MAPTTSTNGFILAGGQSRRMGDKAALAWGNSTSGLTWCSYFRRLPARFASSGEESFDRIPDCGPLGGILTALESSDIENSLFLAVDLPLLTRPFLQVFHARFLTSSKQLLACRVEGKYPLCLGVRRSLAAGIDERIAVGSLAVQGWIEELGAATRRF
jgi:molybdopterin-guanine dinucleotide biosynthesis protein A